MKRIIRFSRAFLFTAILSSILIISGIAAYWYYGGFNIGVDFQAGLIQEVQLAPTAFDVTWEGRGNATISFSRTGLFIVVTGAGIESRTHTFLYNDYPTIGRLADAMGTQVEGIAVNKTVPDSINTQWLINSAQGNPYLGRTPYIVHYLAPGSEPISINTVREAMTSLGQTASVQEMGQKSDRHFMIRVEDKGIEDVERVSTEQVTNVLEGYFGSGEIVILRSDYVGSRFSKDLSDRAGLLLGLTLLLILIYSSIRFKPQYAIGAVLAILHDALIMVAFIVWSRMEFNTISIAAVMTILGYSINDTIVVFDRIRETRQIYPTDSYVDILNRAITETLSRTIITTLTTMLAVVFLFIFATGTMKDFALLLMVGMVSGVYSTIFIASGFINWWEIRKIKRDKRKTPAAVVPAKA
jgi:preprotein translocase subunit SecF